MTRSEPDLCITFHRYGRLLSKFSSRTVTFCYWRFPFAGNSGWNSVKSVTTLWVLFEFWWNCNYCQSHSPLAVHGSLLLGQVLHSNVMRHFKMSQPFIVSCESNSIVCRPRSLIKSVSHNFHWYHNKIISWWCHCYIENMSKSNLITETNLPQL